jgi:hypothetical protein
VEAVRMSDSRPRWAITRWCWELAARSLADFFDTVTVVERDLPPDTDDLRLGLPQSRRLHALLARGAQVIDEVFPGVLDDMVLDGAQYFDGQDLSRLYYNVGGHLTARSGSATSFTAYLRDTAVPGAIRQW